MKAPIAMRHNFCGFASLITLAGLLLSLPVQAKDTSPLEGIHVHRSGVSPYFLNAAKTTLNASEAQCKQLSSVCAMLPAGAGAKDVAVCAAVANGFSFRGNVSDVGKQETDEYFATGMHMAARQTEKTVLKVKSVCEIEVVAQKSADIWHYSSQGYTHYELKDRGKNGRNWVRTDHKRPSSKTGALLAGVFPLPVASPVSPVLGHKTYAGYKCEVRKISGPWAGTFCLKATATAFPGYVALAGSVVAGKDIMLEDAATEVTEKVMLPATYFYPPAGEKSEAKQVLPASAENATQKWCAKQKIKTGINPCEDGSRNE
jgi:hypothetical protein